MTEARLLYLAGGDSMSGTDFWLNPAPYGTLLGRVVNSHGMPAVGATVTASPLQRDFLPTRTSLVTDRNGRFVHPALPLGPYLLEVASEGESPEFVSLEVDIRDAGPELVLATRRGFPVRANVFLDGGVFPEGAKSKVRVDLLTPDGTHPRATTMSVLPDGSFGVPNISGRLLLRVTGLPAGVMVLRVVHRGIDVTDEGIDVRDARFTNIEVHTTARPSRLDGEVIGRDGKPFTGMLLVYSEDPRWWMVYESRRVRNIGARDGKFGIAGLPEGRYLVAIDEHFDLLNWADPMKLERMRAYAAGVSIAEGSTSIVTVRQR